MPIGRPDADGLTGKLIAGSAAAFTKVLNKAEPRGPTGTPSISFGYGVPIGQGCAAHVGVARTSY